MTESAVRLVGAGELRLVGVLDYTVTRRLNFRRGLRG